MSKPGSKYRSEMCEIVRDACSKEERTNGQLAEILSVVEDTIVRWKKEYPDFADAVTRGNKERMVRLCEEKLVDKALGYQYEETKFFHYRGKVIEKKITKKEAPDTKALLAVLAALKPSVWGPNTDLPQETESGGVIVIPAVSTTNVEWESNWANKKCRIQPGLDVT